VTRNVTTIWGTPRAGCAAVTPMRLCNAADSAARRSLYPHLRSVAYAHRDTDMTERPSPTHRSDRKNDRHRRSETAAIARQHRDGRRACTRRPMSLARLRSYLTGTSQRRRSGWRRALMTAGPIAQQGCRMLLTAPHPLSTCHAVATGPDTPYIGVPDWSTPISHIDSRRSGCGHVRRIGHTCNTAREQDCLCQPARSAQPISRAMASMRHERSAGLLVCSRVPSSRHRLMAGC